MQPHFTTAASAESTLTVGQCVGQLAEVRYQGPVATDQPIGYAAGPSLQDQETSLPKGERAVEACQSNQLYEWVHALATIVIIKEKVITGGFGLEAGSRVATANWRPPASALDFLAAIPYCD